MREETDLDNWINHAEDDFNAVGKLLRGKKNLDLCRVFSRPAMRGKIHEGNAGG